MILDLTKLLSGEVNRINVDFELQPELEDGLTVALDGVEFTSLARVKGVITDNAGYMRLALTVSLDYSGECARCLAPVSGEFATDLEKTVATKDSLGDLSEDKLDDYAIIEDGFLDIDSELFEQLEMEFPARFLCDEDCRGLCQRCGKNLNFESCDCMCREVDPRLLPLQKILDAMKKENK